MNGILEEILSKNQNLKQRS